MHIDNAYQHFDYFIKTGNIVYILINGKEFDPDLN